MSDPYFQKLFAERIGGENYGKSTEIYKFEKIKRAKRKAIEQYPDRDLLDFGIGENDEMAAESVRRVMAAEISKPENRGYADNGVAEFKDAVVRFMARQFEVHLDPTTEVNHCIGSKTALAMLPAVFINPGDVTLMTVPGYPVAGTHTKYYGGEVYPLPLSEENDFYPDLEAIPKDIKKRAKLLVINYPNSPTGKTATPQFFGKVIQFAKENNVVVVQDAAHMMLTFGRKPLSFLQVPGAKDVGVEVHSLSKGWNMIGWRIGWVCGNAKIVRAYRRRQGQLRFRPVHRRPKGGRRGAGRPRDPRGMTRQKYFRRLNKLVDALSECGFQCKTPGGVLFPLYEEPQGSRRRTGFRNSGRRRPVFHHRTFHLHRPLGRRRRLPPLLRHLPGPRRSGRRRPHDRVETATAGD